MKEVYVVGGCSRIGALRWPAVWFTISSEYLESTFIEKQKVKLGHRTLSAISVTLTLGLHSTCISVLVGLRRGNVADLSVISACEVLVVSGSVKSTTESQDFVK